MQSASADSRSSVLLIRWSLVQFQPSLVFLLCLLDIRLSEADRLRALTGSLDNGIPARPERAAPSDPDRMVALRNRPRWEYEVSERHNRKDLERQ
jgi:hypothetical protein